MKPYEREFLVARIISGTIRLMVEGKRFFVKNPSREQRYLAQEIYQEQLQEEDAFSDEELYDYLMDTGWTSEKENLLKALPKEIDQFKIGLYQIGFKDKEKLAIRRALGIARDKLAELTYERHSQDLLSSRGLAELAKNRYLMGCSLFDERGPVFIKDFWEEEVSLLDEAMSAHARVRLSEKQIRELARTDPWRSIFACRESDLFGCPAVDFTEEQKGLVSYSLLYHNIQNLPDCPPEDIIEDDDCLDGFLLLKQREREQNVAKSSADSLLNEKIRNAGEVFIVTDNVEGAKKIDALNDPQAAAIKRQRMAYLKKKGEVDETEMPDSKLKIKIMKNQQKG